MLGLRCAVFDEHVRRGGRGSGGKAREMDFESFLDFVLALENRETPEGLTYLFRCLDLHNRGFLTTVDVHTLFRSVIYQQLRLICREKFKSCKRSRFCV